MSIRLPHILPPPEASFVLFKSLVPFREFIKHGRLTLISKEFSDLHVQMLGYSKTCLEVGLGCVDDTGLACGPMVAMKLDFEHGQGFPLKIEAMGRRISMNPLGTLDGALNKKNEQEAQTLLCTILSGFLSCYYDPEPNSEGGEGVQKEDTA